MYEYVTGKLVSRRPACAVVDVGGVGYRVDIPLSTYEKLPRQGTVTLLTHLHVSEEGHRLYGFLTERERELFRRLTAVPQLGPAKAVVILSSVAPSELAKAIEAGDVARLRRVKGIGEKIARRLVLELRGKLPDEEGIGGGDPSLTQDAVGALVTLGVDRRQAEDAVRRAFKDLGEGAPVEDVIKRSLQHV